ncbi:MULTISPECIES: hypothetical protein [unclassified Microbacterium]|uniref:hypothetical protein n=1 Tax=unclassified Microbacterium TaxID=2609290 RepID=UPI00214B92A0|nr:MULTISPECIES: hypothetical protein [unclassified Microbacterium]MCR2785439.1 hypothetical protein [Microbacterium sp. zg.B96]WIM14534.1 hypothetical protein QNO11_08065 [Microbacterium sp. zg-B96]
MATVLTTGASVIAPTIVLNISSSREAQNLVHPIIGRAQPDITLRTAGVRTGQLELGFEGLTSEADSATAESLLAGAAVWTIVSDERSTLEFSFVVTGSVTRDLDSDSRDAWVVKIDYQEVGV